MAKDKLLDCEIDSIVDFVYEGAINKEFDELYIQAGFLYILASKLLLSKNLVTDENRRQSSEFLIAVKRCDDKAKVKGTLTNDTN